MKNEKQGEKKLGQRGESRSERDSSSAVTDNGL